MRLPVIALVALVSLSSFPPAPARAQEEPLPEVAASSVASVAVMFNAWELEPGQWLEQATAVHGPARILIEYGQPHARGRTIVGGLVPYDSIWRTGANFATHLTTDVDLTLGGAFVPRGTYTLLTIPGRDGWTLVVSRQTRRFGTYGYDPAHDVARVPLRVRTRSEPLESLTFWLIPELEGPARGVLRMAWETTELETDWSVAR